MDIDEYILQKFSSNKTGRKESDLAYRCRLYWIRNNFPSSKEVAKACDTTYGNVSNYKVNFNWNSIKDKIVHLQEIEKQKKYNQYQEETLESLQKINKERSGVLIFRLEFLLKEVGAIGEEINLNLTKKDIKEYWEEIYTIIKLLSQIQKDRLRDACLPERINDKLPIDADVKTEALIEVGNNKSKEELDKEYEDRFAEYLEKITTSSPTDV